MSSPETRTVFVIINEYENEVQRFKQQAIPWCTTHDFVAQTEDNAGSGFTPGLCFSAHRDGSCTISTGGPDHKWWEDE